MKARKFLADEPLLKKFKKRFKFKKLCLKSKINKGKKLVIKPINKKIIFLKKSFLRILIKRKTKAVKLKMINWT